MKLECNAIDSSSAVVRRVDLDKVRQCSRAAQLQAVLPSLLASADAAAATSSVGFRLAAAAVASCTAFGWYLLGIRLEIAAVAAEFERRCFVATSASSSAVARTWVD